MAVDPVVIIAPSVLVGVPLLIVLIVGLKAACDKSPPPKKPKRYEEPEKDRSGVIRIA